MKQAVTVKSCRRAAGNGSPEQLLLDLAEVLKGDLSLCLNLDSEDAVIVIGFSKTLASGRVAAAHWARMTPRERAETVIAWIREAAQYRRHPRSRHVADSDVSLS